MAWRCQARGSKKKPRGDSHGLTLIRTFSNPLPLIGRKLRAGRKAAATQIGQNGCLEGTFNPLAQVQFGQDAFPEFSQFLLLTTAFEDEDEYEMPNAKREAWGECKDEILEAHR